MKLDPMTPSNPVATPARSRNDKRWKVCRGALGIVLLVAALLKAHELATVPILGPGLLQQRWLLLGVLEVELVFGGWLLVGKGGRLTWVLTLLLWTVFLTIAAVETFTGAASCGCFGRVRVNPAYTAVFDLAAVLSLAYCRPDRVVAPATPHRTTFASRVTAATLVLAGAGFGIWNVGHFSVGRSNADGLATADGITVLEPSKWVGNPFALAQFIDTSAFLGQGDWLVLLYRHDCEHCQLAVPRYEALATRTDNDPDNLSIALIEMPPYASPDKRLYGPRTRAAVGRLSADRDWFASTPVAIRLHDGIVKSAVEGDAAVVPNMSTSGNP